MHQWLTWVIAFSFLLLIRSSWYKAGGSAAIAGSATKNDIQTAVTAQAILEVGAEISLTRTGTASLQMAEIETGAYVYKYYDTQNVLHDYSLQADHTPSWVYVVKITGKQAANTSAALTEDMIAALKGVKITISIDTTAYLNGGDATRLVGDVQANTHANESDPWTIATTPWEDGHVVVSTNSSTYFTIPTDWAGGETVIGYVCVYYRGLSAAGAAQNDGTTAASALSFKVTVS